MGRTFAVLVAAALMLFAGETAHAAQTNHAYKSHVFQAKLAKARSLGFGTPVDQCHPVGKKPGQEIFVAIFNKPGPVPKSISTKNY